MTNQPLYLGTEDSAKGVELEIYCTLKTESTAFPVKIISNQNIANLKKVIKTEKSNSLGSIDADKLTLHLIPGGATKIELTKLPKNSLKVLDDEFEKLDKCFPDGAQDGLIYIIVETPQRESSDQILKRKMEEDPQYALPSKKTRIQEHWREYEASDGILVELPPSWIDILEGSSLKPAPRSQFAHLKDDLKPGDSIIIPSMGQFPKDFGKYNKDSSLLITEQMLELWDEMQGQQRITYRRVLSGPMGVGKSYLSYFLAARAYAEGWLTLYIADAGVLDAKSEQESEAELVQHFLALNSDILTSHDLETLAEAYQEPGNLAVSKIFKTFLMQRSQERKTLTVVDEHGKLFRSTEPVPDNFKSLKPLMDLASWTDGNLGSRLILTGTAHAKYELKVMEPSFRCDSMTVVFVGPLSELVFMKLLGSVPNLSFADYKVIENITNRVPRELMYLSTHIEKNPNLPSEDTVVAFRRYEDERMTDFLRDAKEFYEKIDSQLDRTEFYKGLTASFLHDSVQGDFKWEFIDLGLLYRLRRDGKILFRPLCNATRKALLELLKLIPTP